jgi:hypothetical protein
LRESKYAEWARSRGPGTLLRASQYLGDDEGVTPSITITITSVARIGTAIAATNKCLAQSNKSRAEGKCDYAVGAVIHNGASHMAHLVDGFDVKYVNRAIWKAEIRRHGRLVDPGAPVAWKGDYSYQDRLLDVHFQNVADARKYNSRKEPFIVALAIPKDENKDPVQFGKFVRLFTVKATGNMRIWPPGTRSGATNEVYVLGGARAD